VADACACHVGSRGGNTQHRHSDAAAGTRATSQRTWTRWRQQHHRHRLTTPIWPG